MNKKFKKEEMGEFSLTAVGPSILHLTNCNVVAHKKKKNVGSAPEVEYLVTTKWDLTC